MKFIIFRDKWREWRWRLVGRNGRSVACSGEGYKRKASAIKAIQRVRDACNAPIEEG